METQQLSLDVGVEEGMAWQSHGAIWYETQRGIVRTTPRHKETGEVGVNMPESRGCRDQGANRAVQWNQVTLIQPNQPVVPALPPRATTFRQRLMRTLSAYHAGKGDWG